MNTAMFKCTFHTSGYSREYTLGNALNLVFNEEDETSLTSLKIGGTFTDSDGDQWERLV